MKKNLRDVTRPVRTFKARIKNFFGIDFKILLRKKAPFLRHTGQALKPKEGFLLYMISAVLIVGLLAIAIIQLNIYSKTITDTGAVRRDTAELNKRLSGDMTQYSIDEAAKSLEEIFDAGQLALITQKYYEYQLLINGDPYTTAMKTIKSGTVKIEMIEKTKPTKLPAVVVGRGSITGGDVGTKLSSYLTVEYSTSTIKQKYDAAVMSLENMSSAIYTISDAAAGNTITLTLRPNLMDKLKVPDIKIELKVQ